MYIDGSKISTYEFPSEKALDHWRSAVSRDGSTIPTRMGGIAIVEWSPPHFYGAGKLLVLYFGDKRRTLGALDLLLGRPFAGR